MHSNCNTIFLFQTTEIYSISTMIIFRAAAVYFAPNYYKTKVSFNISAVVYNTIPSPASERTLESTNELMGG